MPEHSQPLVSVAAALALAQATAQIFAALRQADLSPIVIKGSAQAGWLNIDPGSKTSIDVDVLINPTLRDHAHRTLRAMRYRPEVDVTPGVPSTHAESWVKDGHFRIDLHSSLFGSNPKTTHSVLSRYTEVADLNGTAITIPNEPTRCLIIAIHAAQHGPNMPETIADLQRACQVATTDSWVTASYVAREIGALTTFAAGLSLCEGGRRIVVELGIAEVPLPAETILRLGGAPPTATGFELLTRQRGIARQLQFIARKIVPPAAFMRDWEPSGRRTDHGLPYRYVYRILWLARSAPRGWIAWRRAKSRATRID